MVGGKVVIRNKACSCSIRQRSPKQATEREDNSPFSDLDITVAGKQNLGNCEAMSNVVLRWALSCALGASLGLSAPSVRAQTTDRPVATSGVLSSEQKRRAEQLTSLFENDTLELQYGYCAALKDGRGFTAGRAGFVTSTDEVYRVVKAYVAKNPPSELAAFLPRLKYLMEEQSDETSGLKGFPQAWKRAAKDPLFRAIQDDLVEELFWAPALEHARKLHIRTPLAIAAIHDSIIQHGNDSDPDGLPALLEHTRKEAGGTPATGISEKKWLAAFLNVRREHLTNASEPATREEWRNSPDRILVLEAIAKSDNYNLTGPIVVKSEDFEAVIP